MSQISADCCQVACLNIEEENKHSIDQESFLFSHLHYHTDHAILSFSYQDINYQWPADLITQKHGAPQLILRRPRGDQLLYVDESYMIVDDTADEVGDGHIVAPMNGKLLSIDCQVGQVVQQGQRLFTLEAMKLEHSIVANADGVVSEIYVSQGQQMSPKQPLAQITPELQGDES